MGSIRDLKAQQAKLGVFKGGEKKRLQEQIDAKQQQLDKTVLKISEQRKALQDKKNDEILEVKNAM
jgi:hypothetical protein